MIICDQYYQKNQVPDREIRHVSTYEFTPEAPNNEHRAFVKRYEWLGTMGVSPRWIFTARDRGELVALVGLNEPNAYSKVLNGIDPIQTQCLIQRGASSHLAHQHTGSKLIMFAVKWMTQNTSKRAFFGYSDMRAGELGTIYSACNFDFMGWGFGTKEMYRHPIFMDSKPFSSQIFNRTAWIKKFLRDNGVEWQPEWSRANGFKQLSAIPQEIKNLWREFGRQTIKESEIIKLPAKGKWIKVQGQNRTEQRVLDEAKLYKTYPHPRRDDPKLLIEFEKWKGFMRYLEPNTSALNESVLFEKDEHDVIV